MSNWNGCAWSTPDTGAERDSGSCVSTVAVLLLQASPALPLYTEFGFDKD